MRMQNSHGGLISAIPGQFQGPHSSAFAPDRAIFPSPFDQRPNERVSKMNVTTYPMNSPPATDRPTLGPPVHATGAGDAHPRRWQALGVLCVGLLLIALDTTVLNVALPTLARQLRASTSALQWIVDGYTVALGCLLLLFGAVGDRFGRRRVLLAGLGVFAAASVLAAYAHSTNVLIAARVLAGVGGAVILPCTLASVLSLFPEPRRTGEGPRGVVCHSRPRGRDRSSHRRCPT